jgi:hypothetical protein
MRGVRSENLDDRFTIAAPMNGHIEHVVTAGKLRLVPSKVVPFGRQPLHGSQGLLQPSAVNAISVDLAHSVDTGKVGELPLWNTRPFEGLDGCLGIPSIVNDRHDAIRQVL